MGMEQDLKGTVEISTGKGAMELQKRETMSESLCCIQHPGMREIEISEIGIGDLRALPCDSLSITSLGVEVG